MLVFRDIILETEIELTKSILHMVICENDFTIAWWSNGVVECHILLGEYLNLLLKPEFCGLNEICISLNGIKNKVHHLQIGTGVTRVISCKIVNTTF